MQYTQHLTIDVFKQEQFQYIHAVQFDHCARQLVVTPTANGEPLTIPNNATAVFRCLKHDGTSVVNPATVDAEAGTITFELTDQALACEGMARADVSIIDGENVISTLTFFIMVEKAPTSDSQVVSSNEFLYIVQVAAEVEAYTERAEAAAASAASEAAVAAENALAEAKASGEFDGANGKDGADGTSVTVSSVSESTEDGGSNVVTFSDGKTLTIKNGNKGNTGKTGERGADGVSPSAKVEQSGSNAVITITDANGTTSATVSAISDEGKAQIVEDATAAVLASDDLNRIENHTTDTTVHITVAERTNWNNKSNFSGNYNDLTNKPTIPTVPTNVSAFTNDAGYLTEIDKAEIIDEVLASLPTWNGGSY